MRNFCLLFISLLIVGCHPIEEFPNDNRGTFNALWTEIDENYCFFVEKNIDWQEVGNKYSPLVTEDLTKRQLFEICAAMVNELRDGHTNLSAPFETSYYRNWWSDYPQNFNARIIEQNYLQFDYHQLGNVTYGMLPQNVAYVGIPSFSSGLANGNIDWLLSSLTDANGLIRDLRDNGAGSMNLAENWVCHFSQQPLTVGYMVHKTGPGHEAFDSPYPIEFKPLESLSTVWIKPVVVLTNRSTFSAANYMVMCMKALPNVTIAGATTGGGAGMPISRELPNGWSIRMSAVRVYDAQMKLTEAGIDPSEGCEVSMDPEQELLGRDTMLDFAISLLQ